jgi:iron(III) transport system permease protein
MPRFRHHGSPMQTPNTLAPLARLLPTAAVLMALLVALPLLAVVGRLADPSAAGSWQHLLATVLPDYLRDTMLLCAGVAGGTFMLGTFAAWLVAAHRFPGRDLFSWALVLPLAMPAWIVAYTYTDWLQFAGPVQTLLRDLTGWQYGDYAFPPIRSLGGAIVVFSLVLYPYVYLLARDAFLDASGSLRDASRSLGAGYFATLFRVALPMARPAIAVGLALALMETVADFGAVSYFGVQTFTTGIYRAWYSLGDPVASAQLAAVLLTGVIALLVLERHARGRARFVARAGQRRAEPQTLTGWRAALATLACAIPLAGGFVLPVLLLGLLAAENHALLESSRYLLLATHSATLSATVAVVAVIAALLLGYAARGARRGVRAVTAAAGFGYAVPGTVLAVGVLTLASAVDSLLFALNGDALPPLLLGGSLLVVVYALVVRFVALAQGSIDAGLARIQPSMDDAARALGEHRLGVLRRVHAPMLAGSLLTALLMVFVEVMKELPATLMLRPFGFDTLATQAWLYAADERLGEAAWPSLLIVLVGLLPVLLLTRRGQSGGT